MLPACKSSAKFGRLAPSTCDVRTPPSKVRSSRHPIHVRHPGSSSMADPRESARGAGTSVDPVQLPAPARRARHRVDRVEPGDRARPRRTSRAPRRHEHRPSDRRVSRRARRRSASPAMRIPHRLTGRRRPGVRVARSGRRRRRRRAVGSMSCTRGRSPPAARSRRPRPRGIPARPGGAEHPHRARVRRRGRRARTARPRAAARRIARRSTPRRLREEEREWVVGDRAAHAIGCGRTNVPRSRVRSRPRAAAPVRLPARSRRLQARIAASRPFTAVFLGRGEPRKGLHYALRAWLASSASEHGRFVVYGSFVPGYRESLADHARAPERRARGLHRRRHGRARRGRCARAAEPRGGQCPRDLRGAGGRVRAARLDRGRAPCSNTACRASCTNRVTSRR